MRRIAKISTHRCHEMAVSIAEAIAEEEMRGDAVGDVPSDRLAGIVAAIAMSLDEIERVTGSKFEDLPELQRAVSQMRADFQQLDSEKDGEGWGSCVDQTYEILLASTYGSTLAILAAQEKQEKQEKGD